MDLLYFFDFSFVTLALEHMILRHFFENFVAFQQALYSFKHKNVTNKSQRLLAHAATS